MREMYTPFKGVRRSWLANGKHNYIGALHKDSVTSQYMFSRLSQWQGRLTWLCMPVEIRIPKGLVSDKVLFDYLSFMPDNWWNL